MKKAILLKNLMNRKNFSLKGNEIFMTSICERESTHKKINGMHAISESISCEKKTC